MDNTTKKRKRSLFSCDRCKIKKIACHRVNGNPNIYEPCATCQVLKLECKTTIKRKKRKFDLGSLSKINHEYMVRIIQLLDPSVDINETTSLKHLHEKLQSKDAKIDDMKIKNDSPDTQNSDYESDNENFEVIYSGKSVDGIVSTAASFGLDQGFFDRVIYDNNGISHYMGSFGFTSSLTMLLNNFIRLTKKQDISSIKFVQSMNKRGSIIASFAENTDLTNLDPIRFPLICYLSKEEAAFYVNKYSRFNTELLGGINKEKFQRIYDKFWKIHSGLLPKTSLTYAQYCCIYSIWINGISIELYPGAKMQETYEIMDKYINLIKVLLSDIVLVPSHDGILCLLLLSYFFERNMQVETSYILCQTAVCQAMACGYHRESIATNETSYLWWSLFSRELTLGYYLGRTSSIPLRLVNIKYEQRFKESLDTNLENNLLLTELNKLVYISLCNRTKLPLSAKSVSDEHVNSALHMDSLFEDFFNQLPTNFKERHYLQPTEAEILMSYYSIKMSSTLPFILYPIEHLSNKAENVIKLIEKSLQAAIEYVKFLLTIESYGFDQLIFTEASVSSYAMMCFVSGSLFYKISCNALTEKPANSKENYEQIQHYATRLRNHNQKRIENSRGTMRIRRYWIEVLFEDLTHFNADDDNDMVIQKLRRTILGDNDSESSDHNYMVDSTHYITPTNIPSFFDMTMDNYLAGESVISEIFNGLSK